MVVLPPPRESRARRKITCHSPPPPGRTPTDIATARGHHHIADAIRAEEIRRRDHGFKRDRSTIEGTEEHEAAKRPRVEEEPAAAAEAVDESDDDDDDDDDNDDEES